MIEEQRERAESRSSPGGAHEVVRRTWRRRMFGNRPCAKFVLTEFLNVRIRLRQIASCLAVERVSPLRQEA